ncbi:hypothetical protein [Azospirillum melinis]
MGRPEEEFLANFSNRGHVDAFISSFLLQEETYYRFLLQDKASVAQVCS